MEPSDNLTELMEFLADLPAFNPRKWVESELRDPFKKQVALNALEAFECLITRESIQAEDLAPILRAAQDTSTLVADFGIVRLMELAEKHNIVLDTLRELFASTKLKDRFVVIASLRCALPRDFLLEMVSKGLTDRSGKIRWKAAQVCGGLGLKELLPLMESRLSVEKNSDASYELKCSTGILKEGYYLHHTKEGHLWLTVKKTSGQIVTRGLKREQIDKEGLAAIVERMKSEP